MKKRILVGVFIVGGILLFAFGLFLIGSQKQLFSHHYDVYAGFNQIDTLTTGAKVRVSGMDAGQIASIEIPKTPSSRFRLKLEVDEKFRPIIREDSLASIETEGMVGNKYVEIDKGSDNSPECPPNGTLPTREPVELGDLMRQASGIASSAQSTIEDLRKHSVQTIEHVNHLVGHADGAIQASRADVKAITANGARLTENANQIVSSVREGKGAAGKLLTDETIARNIDATVANAKAASASVAQAAQNANQTTTQLHQSVSTFLKPDGQAVSTARELRDTVQSADRAVTNLKDDTDAVKHNFFLRGFFKRRGFYDLTNLTPEKYSSTRFVKKPRARVWVPAAGLFTSQPDGKQELSRDGPAILNQEMSAIVKYLPNNPIMVEGYSSQGAADQQFQASRQRALDVRDYLASTFHIDPKFIGAIPLGDRPPRGAGRDQWDGVCLVLVVSK
jgi:phospholipid/cholesterol/gamma-HCH transport system substrate-binding protein